GSNENYFKLIKDSVETLFTTCDENHYNVRFTAEENLNKFIKNLKESVFIRIQVELHRIIKDNPNIERKALKVYFYYLTLIYNWVFFLISIKCSMVICRISKSNVSHESALILRSSIASFVIITRYSYYPIVIARFLMTNAIDQLFEDHNQNDSTHLTIGYLGLIKKPYSITW
ncbi:unnamed protein product, partial [Rotaria sp. Silwood2]